MWWSWWLICFAVMAGGCTAVTSGPARDYYVSLKGDDDGSADGSIARPLRSIARANKLTLHPGDRLLFEGGATFDGNLELNEHDAGTTDRPVYIGSYGTGVATIRAGEGTGICARNAAGIVVERLRVVGSGSNENLGSGIHFVNERGGHGGRLGFVRIKFVDVHGFGLEGIHVDALAQRGFDDVRIENCLAYDNARCGIYVAGPRDRAGNYPHANVYVGHCAAHDNPGDADASDENRTGSGIFLSGVDGGVIEYCEATGNGRLCRARRGGPMGIWASESNRVTIQSCRSVGNRTGGPHDGGGFGLDGGMTNSTLQYNYSADNDGSGYGLFEYFGAKPWHGNTVRYNVSDNDGRRNGYAGIHLWNGAGPGELRDAWVYHNSIRIAAAAAAAADSYVRPRALWVQSETADVRVMNNVFVTSPGLNVVEIAPDQRGIRLGGNCYWSGPNGLRIAWDGGQYVSLTRWRRASGQEPGTGIEASPLFAPGEKGIGGFRFLPASPLLNAAVSLPVDTGGRDIVGTTLPQGAGFDVGAWEMPAR